MRGRGCANKQSQPWRHYTVAPRDSYVTYQGTHRQLSIKGSEVPSLNYKIILERREKEIKSTEFLKETLVLSPVLVIGEMGTIAQIGV